MEKAEETFLIEIHKKNDYYFKYMSNTEVTAM